MTIKVGLVLGCVILVLGLGINSCGSGSSGPAVGESCSTPQEAKCVGNVYWRCAWDSGTNYSWTGIDCGVSETSGCRCEIKSGFGFCVTGSGESTCDGKTLSP